MKLDNLCGLTVAGKDTQQLIKLIFKKTIKMYKSLIIIMFIILNGSCNKKQEILELPIEVNLNLSKQYVQTYCKANYNFGLENIGYEVLGDSLIQQLFDIKITVKNNSNKSVFIWLMSCGWQNNFIINNDYMFIDVKDCDKNYPQNTELKAGESCEYITTLKKSIKFDYPCKGCMYGKQVEATKIGLIVVNDPFKNEVIDYTTYMNDKSKWKIYWSNPLYLLTPKEMNPAPLTIPVNEK